jgi:TetR/AcrR family transcriptional regulator, cholesterol catabolism regulator
MAKSAVRSRRVTKRLRQADRKRQLLTHAKQLFLTLGYHATTTEKIAQSAGVTEPIVYRHFDDKKGLFLEVLREIRESTLQRWQAEIAQTKNPLEKLQTLAQDYLGSTRDHASEFQVLHRSLVETQDADIAAFLRAFYLDCETLLAQVVAEGQKSGLFRGNLDPRVGAWELIRTALAYTLTLPLGIPLYEEPDYAAQAIDCLLECMLNKKSTP